MALALVAIATGCSQSFEVGSMAAADSTAGTGPNEAPSADAAPGSMSTGGATGSINVEGSTVTKGGKSSAGGPMGGRTPGGESGSSSVGSAGAPGGSAGAPASCTDAVRNGAETDIDCGGPCAPCAEGQACTLDRDCASAACISTLCAPSMPSGAQLETSGWMAYASNSLPSSKPDAVFDGKIDNGWTSGVAQSPGMWFTLDMGKPELFFSLGFYVANPDEAPQVYDVLGSLDGKVFVLLQGDLLGNSMNQVVFQRAQYFRYVRLMLKTSHPQWWSLGELWISR